MSKPREFLRLWLIIMGSASVAAAGVFGLLLGLLYLMRNVHPAILLPAILLVASTLMTASFVLFDEETVSTSPQRKPKQIHPPKEL